MTPDFLERTSLTPMIEDCGVGLLSVRLKGVETVEVASYKTQSGIQVKSVKVTEGSMKKENKMKRMKSILGLCLNGHDSSSSS